MKRFGVGALILALLIGFAGMASADETIFRGLDPWYTPSGGGSITVDIPAGFFCNGTSGPIPGKQISLKGRPVVTVPIGVLNPDDTVVDRIADALFNGGLSVTTQLRIRSLNLVSVSSFTVTCSSGLTEVWNTEVSLDAAFNPQPLGTIVIRRPFVGALGGDFDASFPVHAKIVFVNAANGARTAPLADNPTITTLNACWTHQPGPGAVVWPNPVTLDSDGDQVADYTSPYGTSNFFPGWKWVNGVLVQCPVAHQGPHPTTCSASGSGCPEQTSTNPCTKDVVSYLSSVKTANGFQLANAATLNAKFTRRPKGKATGTVGGVDQPVSGSLREVAVTSEDIGSVRIDRCIQAQGAAILSGASQ
jgi:hypothetical protein